MGALRVTRYADPAAFLAAAEDWLCRREVENNLLLGLAGEMAAASAAGGDAPYFATVLREGAIAGCAFRTISGKIGVTQVDDEAARRALAADAIAATPDAVSVLGPEPTVTAFAELVARAAGRVATLRMRQRIHEISTVTITGQDPEGGFRAADPRDVPALTPWIGAMLLSLSDPRDPAAVTRERIDAGQLFLWEYQFPVTMAAWTGKTRTSVRVNFVYTPPEQRNRGYATACVTALTRHLLARGHRSCCLYTDLANPTSNAIYARIGYRPVCDAALYSLGSQGVRPGSQGEMDEPDGLDHP